MPRLPSLSSPPLKPAKSHRAHPPSLSLLADSCTSMRQIVQVHAHMIVTGRISDNYAASRVLSFAALHPSGHLPHALALFSSSPSPNSFMYNTLIRALAASPFPSRALLLYPQMLLQGPPPGCHTFPFLLKAAATGGDLFAARQIHTHAFRHGLDSDPYVANGLIRSYGTCGFLDDARQLFDEMHERNAIVWTTMVSGYAQNFCSNEAVELFLEMMRTGIEPCDAALASVLSACARLGGLQLGRQIHELIIEKEIVLGVILGTALIDMYVKNGEICVARKLFVEMPERNIATWNALICGSAHYGHARYALELFQQMEEELEIQPNDITIVGVLTACCHAGKIDLARRVFHSMEKNYGIEPKVEHYGCMVDLLGRSGRLKEAEELVKGMKWEADVVVLGALLSACRSHGEIEIAERVVENILRVDPENHGVYVVLSNMYAEVGRWEDVERLRRVMRHGGLKKISGWSCFDGTES
ncbi:pentatricopeptide repeat-containing protein At5g56310-like [Dendrobium catenatum]|uniref:Pentatricopeptide repeat-containing protein n=1 Tax=Dendrobium catenatum TaxID=906689 RepID=A0A2I0X007_9ASPA|nr:pentatricopeptide repeat-containing protein At5g56310-like [Dendrobium catenatum]PKU81248.1 Pentatricopeptide repeat-containing protein [Dendrobium catenatum]